MPRTNVLFYVPDGILPRKNAYVDVQDGILPRKNEVLAPRCPTGDGKQSSHHHLDRGPPQNESFGATEAHATNPSPCRAQVTGGGQVRSQVTGHRSGHRSGQVRSGQVRPGHGKARQGKARQGKAR